LSTVEFSLLVKFPSEEAAQFLARQLIKEGEEDRIRVLRYAAFKALKQMGDSYFNYAADYVNSKGSPEIKEEFLNRENSWIDPE